MLVVPFLGSIVIDYGIQYHGIMYASPQSLSEQAYDIICKSLPNNEIEFFKKSYTLQNNNGEINQAYYVMNDYGYDNIYELDNVLGPFLSYLYNNKIDKQDLKDLIDEKKYLNSTEIAQVKTDFQEYLNTKDSEKVYSDAIKMKIQNSDILNINIDVIQKEFSNYIIVFFIIVILIYIIVSILSNYFASWISFANSRDLRKKLYVKVINFHGNEFDKFSKGSLITRSTNDIQNIQNACIFLIKNVLISPLFIITAILVSYYIAPDLTWLIWAVFGFIAVFAIIIMIVVSGKFTLIQKIIDNINTTVKDFLNGIFTIRAFNYEQSQIEKFNRFSKELYNKMIRANSLLMLANPYLILLICLLCFFSIWIGKDIVVDGYLSIGSLSAFMFFSVEAIMSFISIAITLILFPRAEVSAKRIEEVLNCEYSIIFKEQSKIEKDFYVNSIQFKNVSFRYNENEDYVIKNANFEIFPNSMNILVGKTGSGKSTIFKLLLRYYDVSEGEILINNHNIKEFNTKELYSLISYVPQKSVVFSDSFKNNINISQGQADPALLNSAVNDSQLSDVIYQYKEGLDRKVAQNGFNLSGGQLQRLNIARALYKDSPILTLDDLFASVDYYTEKKIMTSIVENYKNKIIIYATQRLESVNDQDNILFISENGEVKFDIHGNLIRNNEEYKKCLMRNG